jgi:hypothetical protein
VEVQFQLDGQWFLQPLKEGAETEKGGPNSEPQEK